MNKKNIPLYIALAIPVLMIILVAAFIYLPGIGQKPKYNFLYVTGNKFYYFPQDREFPGYHVISGKLTFTPPSASSTPPYLNSSNVQDPHLYLYDFSTDKATEITFEQAQNYSLDSSNISADGYTIERGNGGGGDFFFGGAPGDYNNWYIKGHNRSHKLNLKLTGNYAYGDNFQFLGWVQYSGRNN